MPLISICIPAYKNAEYLSRLLDSIAKQNFKDFEVIITDDSPDNVLKDLVNKYYSVFNLAYIKNERPLGSPINWNSAISKAKGEWIKIMHDDDWFTDETSLSGFAAAAKKLTNTDFIFSGFYEVDINSNKKQQYIITSYERNLLKKSPYNLLKRNFIGNPSATLIRNNQSKWYDAKLKWVVDIEFYIRILKQKNNFYVIKKPLIIAGVNPLQITKQVFRNPSVEIPENLYLLEINSGILKNIYGYDYYWRFLRNLSIRTLSDLEKYYSDVIPESLKAMLSIQKKFPLSILKNGIASKILMTISYLSNRNK